MIEALDIRVRGIVQGVGFRPFVYRLARRYIITGWVLNDLDGVFIHAEGEGKLLDEFVTELHTNPPAAAVVREVELKEVPLQDCAKFEIRESRMDDAQEGTLVSADLATCDDCLRELFDPSDRRYRYPFINCTNCGPRFTIIDSLPYDRPATSMAGFDMCGQCAKEYADPSDRRFHAQPDACFDCGPRLSFRNFLAQEDGEGVPDEADATREASDALLARAVDVLANGGILAVKGLGGFHLACDAADEQALERLRSRKKRDGKAFAVMMASVDDVREVCEVSPAEELLLKSPARPIVLLRKRPDARFARGLADRLPELGVMLPATPVQHLLLHDYREATGKTALVMTSGNVHDEPIVVDDAEALVKFAGIADAMLGNDRPILARYDDSVVRVLSLGGVNEHGEPNEAVQFIRRARGYAPMPIALGDESSPAVFAAGSEQKSTFAFARAGQAFVSQHIGDLEDADVYDAWLESKARFGKLFEIVPHVLACDAHPEYLATKWARSQAFREGLPCTEVQHHHAHIASVLGEHGLFGPCCGIAFDGTGYGADGAIWGGEVLISNQADFERFANFSYVPMPGGAACIKHPLRMAYGILWAFDLLEHPGARPVLEALGDQASVCEHMIESGLNTPLTSSVGRLFDAVSALCGVCPESTYEGEAAILLDAAQAKWRMRQRCEFAGDRSIQGEESGSRTAGTREDGLSTFSADVVERYAVAITKNAATSTSTAHDTSVVVFDASTTVKAVLDDLVAGVPAGEVSARFHDAIVGAIVMAAQLVRAMYDISLVVLSGGVFMNRTIAESAATRLGEEGFTVALNASLPPNDGCISYGQAVVASASR